jgi:uncharacterized membrane protein HdeD (DUF308 family)
MKLQTNESTPDRIIRVVLGVALLALAFAGVVSGAVAILASVVGAIALVTGIVGFCPLYAILRVSTKPATR